jgi:hypothetical protein
LSPADSALRNRLNFSWRSARVQHSSAMASACHSATQTWVRGAPAPEWAAQGHKAASETPAYRLTSAASLLRRDQQRVHGLRASLQIHPGALVSVTVCAAYIYEEEIGTREDADVCSRVPPDLEHVPGEGGRGDAVADPGPTFDRSRRLLSRWSTAPPRSWCRGWPGSTTLADSSGTAFGGVSGAVLALFLFCRLVRRGGRWRMANAVPVSGAAGVTTVVEERAQRGCSLKLA